MSTSDDITFTLPKPIAVGKDEVVLSRGDWDRIVEAFVDRSHPGDDPDQDAADVAAAVAAREEDAVFAARIARERGAPVEITIPLEVLEAELEGTHPIKAWREHRGWIQVELSAKSGVARDLIAQMETRRKKGSVESLRRLAYALGVPIEALIADADEELE